MIFKYFKNSLSDHMVGCRTTFLNRFDHLDGYRGLLTKVSGFLSAEETVVNRFDHLDGYRGLLAIFVVITHCVWDFELTGDYRVMQMYGYLIGVTGFFGLSAFLLTYRLLKDFNEAQSNIDAVIIVAKYFLKRFFRIYITFLIYCTLIAFFPVFAGRPADTGKIGNWSQMAWKSLFTRSRYLFNFELISNKFDLNFISDF